MTNLEYALAIITILVSLVFVVNFLVCGVVSRIGRKRVVFICSPYRGVNKERNVENAKRYCRHAVMSGKIPICPHLYFTRFLDDGIARERTMGIRIGLECLKNCDEMWVFPNNGISEGMQAEIDFAKKHRIKTVYIYTM